jgi:hypothetical protein
MAARSENNIGRRLVLCFHCDAQGSVRYASYRYESFLSGTKGKDSMYSLLVRYVLPVSSTRLHSALLLSPSFLLQSRAHHTTHTHELHHSPHAQSLVILTRTSRRDIRTQSRDLPQSTHTPARPFLARPSGKPYNALIPNMKIAT